MWDKKNGARRERKGGDDEDGVGGEKRGHDEDGVGGEKREKEVSTRERTNT